VTEQEPSEVVDDNGEDEGPVGSGGRQPVERLWDDEGFRARIAQICEARRIKPRAAMIGAGTSPKFFTEAASSRNTNIVMRVAKVLGVHPAYLMFGPTVATGPGDDDAPLPMKAAGNTPTAEQRLALLAQICASHWLHTSVDPKGAMLAADLNLRQIATLTR
jgi:hypothetical protein